MKVSEHILGSFVFSTITYLATKSLLAAAACFLSGILIDIDHIIDFGRLYGFNLYGLKKLVYASQEDEKAKSKHNFKKIYLFLHSIELACLLWITALWLANIYLIAAVIGYTGHLILDCIGNREDLKFYLFFYRARNKFSAKKLFKRWRRKKMMDED
ncbi:MAG: hypothetical protein JW867_03875 [Candidatus Omnitrophica bacterium]|nr:hypothetical protein [Candidatus Omnitrophota bacterium]